MYRNQNVRIAFSRAVLPRYEKVPNLMSEFIIKYSDLYKKLDKQDYKQILEF
jgi:hypothetical protein